ncbi:MAG TPA: hypothetical protein PLP04_08230 [Bryobacteraceae bacterium]|nr:hypothetical protein [Bryobacteraceae bacterium]HPQ15201.1 hypothetical protein [Bryobacteraceae bacterium]
MAGFLLLSFDKDLARIPAEAIEPAARNGWTAAALNIAAAAEGRKGGVRKVQFEWRAGTRYSSKLARRLGGTVIRELRHVVRPAARQPV